MDDCILWQRSLITRPEADRVLTPVRRVTDADGVSDTALLLETISIQNRLPSCMYIATQCSRLHRDGFVFPVEVFSEQEALRLRNELEAAEAKWPETFQGAARNNAHLNVTCLDEIVYNTTLVDAVEDLIGPDILTCGTVLFIKEPRDPGFVSWHQDARYQGLEPQVGITAWVALSHSNEESGCMQMIPGSHSEIKEHVDTYGDRNILTRGQEVQGVDESKAVSLTLRPGEMSIHSSRVIHF